MEQKQKSFAFGGIILIVSIAGIFVLNNFEKAALTQSASAEQVVNGPVPLEPAVLGASTNIPAFSIRGDTTDIIHKDPVVRGPVDTSAVAAESFLVYDAETGDALLNKNQKEKLPIASLTKLLTGLVVYNHVDLKSNISVNASDVVHVDPVTGLHGGDQAQAGDIFNAMIVGSCNDAANILAKFTSKETGQNFIGLMNQTAAELGMENSKFNNPMGFDSVDNYSTAEDLKKLVSKTEHLAVFTDLGRKIEYAFSNSSGEQYTIKATNKLLATHTEIEAIKTGSTPSARGALISKATKNGHSIVIVVLSSKNREQDTLELENIAFNNVIWP